MTTVPVTRTFVAGEVVLASYFNTNINGPIGFLLAPPILEIRQTTLMTVTTSTWTAATFTTEDVDSSGMHSTSSNTDRCTAVYPGWYQFSGGSGWAANSTGARGTYWDVNAAALNGSQTLEPPLTTGNTSIYPSRTKQIFLNVSDYARLMIWQSSGGNLNTAVSTTEQPHISGRWVSN